MFMQVCGRVVHRARTNHFIWLNLVGPTNTHSTDGSIQFVWPRYNRFLYSVSLYTEQCFKQNNKNNPGG